MGKDPEIFSAAIFKNQIPSSCFITDVVEATRKQYNDNVIDCIQLINGLYRFDFLNKQVKLNFLSRGLKLFDRTIPVMDWYVGLDSPKVRVVIGGLPRETPDYLILEALTKLGVEAVSKLEHDFYRDKVNGGFLKIKTGRRAIMINKPPSPLPQNVRIGDREASIRHWGQNENKNHNVNSLTKPKDTLSVNESHVSLPKPDTEMPKDNADSVDHDSQPLPNSQSLFSQTQGLQVPKIVQVADLFKVNKPPKSPATPKRKSRSVSRGRSTTRNNKRDLPKDGRLESPHKQVKTQTPSYSPESLTGHSKTSDQEGESNAS